MNYRGIKNDLDLDSSLKRPDCDSLSMGCIVDCCLWVIKSKMFIMFLLRYNVIL